MNENPLAALTELGQSIWIDDLTRSRIRSGDIRREIEEDGLRGMTSNPTIFEKAITKDPAYEEPVRELARRGKKPREIFDAIEVEDVRLACDEFRPTFDGLDQRDGFVSIEVSPELADDTAATLEDARRLWQAVGRPNVMIKVPATRAGLPAIEALIAEGISVNITLLFGLDRYDAVAEAYLAGLEARMKQGKPVRVPSVASFFLSRIDTLVDKQLDERSRSGKLDAELAAALRGQVALASARIAYQRYKRHFGGERFRALAERGARVQRLLWASTGTKDPAYSDVYYVEPLIGKDTINTMTRETFAAYRDHGRPELRLEQDVDHARAVLERLPEAGIDLDRVTDQLEREGVKKFTDSYDRLIAAITDRGSSLQQPVAQR